jgi:hypothetical protein
VEGTGREREKGKEIEGEQTRGDEGERTKRGREGS